MERSEMERTGGAEPEAGKKIQKIKVSELSKGELKYGISRFDE